MLFSGRVIRSTSDDPFVSKTASDNFREMGTRALSGVDDNEDTFPQTHTSLRALARVNCWNFLMSVILNMLACPIFGLIKPNSLGETPIGLGSRRSVDRIYSPRLVMKESKEN